ncbi:MAG: C40 family peptidase [Gemmatimonadota bacterium]
MSRFASLPLLVCLLSTRLVAQSPGFEVGHFFDDPGRTVYRLGFSRALTGPIGTTIYGTVLHGGAGTGNFYGAGLDLSAFRGGRPGVYLIAGGAVGIAPGYDKPLWNSWSFGGGYELMPLSRVSLGIEGRYRILNPGVHDGLELSLRVALLPHARASGPPPVAAPHELTPADVPAPADTRHTLEKAGEGDNRSVVIQGIVRTATDVMGTPYRWGGNDADGFDCSGLIRYAFGQHGITLPRRSAEQALEGDAVGRELGALLPGDILTFSNRPGHITHVGLYVGDGKFIHSATGGVRLSTLSADDVYGKWWWKRWVGARRIVK